MSSNEYSIYSDVFAFGMLMWEIAARNSRPFGNLEWIETASKIKKGERPTIPSDCPIQIKNLIERCWNQEPKQRPTMQQIIEYLDKKSNEAQKLEYLDNSISFNLNQFPQHQSSQSTPIAPLKSGSNDLNNNKKQTLRIKQKQALESYLKEIGIEIEEEDEELQTIIDTFVNERFTPKVLKTVNLESLKESFDRIKIAIGFQTQLLAAIKASKI